MPVNIAAARTTSLFTDQDGDGLFDPGDIITTRIRITNSGSDPATGVSVTDTLNGVTLVAGSVEVTPIAFDDFMPSITGNTPITFTAAQLLGNDVDPDGAEINLTISGVSNASNGAIVNHGDGTFTFTPTTGYVGAASFQYTITDEQGRASVSTGIVSFNVTDPVWYVNNATGSDITGDGSWANPFATLTPLNTGGSADGLDNENDTIFVYNAGTYANQSIVLETGQKLFGDGHVFQVNGLNIGANATNTTLGYAGVGVTLASNNTIMGVTLNGSAAGSIGIQDNGDVGTLIIDETSIIGQGKAVDIDSGGTLNVDFDQLSSGSSTSEGIHLQGVSGTFTAATGTIQSSAGTAVLIGAADGLTASSGGDVNFTYGGDISSPTGSLVNIQDRTGGTVTFSGIITEGAIGNGQTGILVDGSAGTINFNGQTFISAGAGTTGNGVALTNNSGTINFNATGTGLDITTTAGTGFTFTGGGTLNITGSANSVSATTGQLFVGQNGTIGTSGVTFGSMTSNGNVTAGPVILLSNIDKNVTGTFNGGNVSIQQTITTDALQISNGSSANATFANFTTGNIGVGSDAIEISGSSGTYSFTGNVTINAGVGNGINLVNNTAGSTTFSGGNLNLDTTSGTGLNATGSVGAHTLVISGANNNITATTGRAINIDGVTSNITLDEVNASGGSTTAVFLKNTGSGGQFVVTGSGSLQGSGGTISNIGGSDMGSAGAAQTQGTGIYMENVSNVSLSNMIIGANAGTMNNFGIRGESVNNFTLRDSEFRGAFGSSTALDEGTIRFGNAVGGTTTGLTGTALFEGNVIGVNGSGSGSIEAGLAIYVYGNNTLNLTIRDSASDQAVFGHNNTSSGTDDFYLESGGTSNVTILIDGVLFQGSRGDLAQISSSGDTTQNITVRNSQFHNTQVTTLDGGGSLNITGSLTGGDVTYLVENNTFKGSRGSNLFSLFNGDHGTIKGVILNNTFGTPGGGYNGDLASYSSLNGGGIFAGIDSKFAGTGTLNYAMRIEGNTIRDFNGLAGITLRSSTQDSGGVARVEATIKNNTVSEIGATAAYGFLAQVGGASLSTDFGKMGLDFTGNTFNVSTGAQGGDAVFLQQVSANAQIYLPGYAGPPNPFTELSSYLENAPRSNILNEGPTHSGTGGAYTNGTLSGGAFVLAVPAMAAAQPGIGWQDLAVSPVTAPPRDPDVVPDTPDVSGGGTGETGGSGGTGGGGNDGGTGTTGDPAPAAGDDNILTLAELNSLVEAAIQRWIDAGATAAQVEAMRAVQFGIVDMAGIYVGSSTHGVINIDSDGAGYGWFVDSTPGEDSEFGGSGTRLTADAGGPAAGKLDLLTVLMHELGHQIGLGDEYVTSQNDDLMYGYMNVGERRLPADGEAAGAVPGSVGATAFALTPVAIGTLPSNKIVDIYFKSTIDLQTDGYLVNPNNTSTISGSNFADQLAQETLALDGLTLANLVFLDVNKDGNYDAGTDTGIVGVSISLYADTNDSGGWDAGDVLIDTKSTLAGGLYSFAGLAPGDYIVVVNASNFGSGGVLENKVSIAGGTDPDDNIDNDDNGIAGVTGLGAAIASQTITLSAGAEPIDDGDLDADTNNSLDFGFIAPNAAPTSTNLDGDIAEYIEGAAPVRLDVGGNATLSDDNANFAGGTLTVAIGTGADTADDVLSIGTTATVTLDAGNIVKVNGTTIGTYAGGTGGTALTITLNSSANAGNVDDLLQALQYNNTDGINPSNDTRSVSITLVDGAGNDGGLGADTLVINSLVNVTDVNDEPAGANNGDTTDDITTLVFDAADFNTGFTDQDGNIFAGVVITTLPPGAQGKIQLNSVDISAGQFVTLAQLNDGDLTFVPVAGQGGTSPTFTFQVRDDGGVLNSGVDTDQSANTFTIAITASNAAPVVDLDGDDSNSAGTGFASAYTEGGAAAAISDTDVVITDAEGDDIISATITITDPETGDKLTVGALPATITVDPVSTDIMVKLLAAPGTPVADFEAAIEAITYSSSSDDPTDKGTNGARTITVVVNDGQGDSNAATATVTITDDNADAPSGTSATITAIEDSFRLIEAADLGFSDVDGTFAGVTISAVTGGGIYFDADGTAGAGAPVLETLPKTYTAQDLIDGKVSFKAGPNANGAAIGTITFAVTDDDGNTDASPNTLTVDVTAVNDAPVLTTGGPIAATEQTAVAILPAGSVADLDLDARNGGDGDYAGASFSVNRNPATNTTEDVFTLVAGPNFTIDGSNLKSGGLIFATINVDGSAGLIVINFTSLETAATSALVDEVIQAVRYTNTSDNPPASVDLAVGFTDGAPGGGQGTVISGNNLDVNLVTVTIAAVNDAPVNSLGGTIGTGEDAIDAWLSGMTISDPDADPATDDIVVTFNVGNGTLEIKMDVVGGVTAGDVSGDGTGTIIVTATLNQINATLAASNGLTYSPNPNFNGNDTLTVTTNDQGANGSDPALTGDGTSEEDVDTRTISVSASPDAPIAQPDAVSTPENVIGTGSLFANNGSGPDSDADGDSFTVSHVDGNPVVDGQPIVLASGAILIVNADGTYSYNPNGKFVKLTDNSSGAVNTSTVGDTFEYTVSGGNTVTVTVTVNGVAGPGDWLMGDGTDNTITGTPQGDFFFVVQGGDDTLTGLGGIDVFFFGGALTSADKVNGGAGVDQIALQGNYAGLTFGADVLGIENLAILPGNDTRFGDPGTNFYDYNLTTLDINVAAGVQMIVDANRLRVGEDFTFNGSAETDGSFFIFGGGGVDTLTGGANNDVFLFGAQGQWGASDVVNGGPGGIDQLALRGDYTITFGAGQLIGIEQIALVSAFDTRFGVLGDTYDYNLTMVDANVVGIQMTVDAAPLRANETLTFNGSAEDDGSFRVFGGAGADTIIGSQNADILVGREGVDTMTGGGGNDVFRYNSVADSNSAGQDEILDFSLGDLVDLSRIDANTLLAGDQAFNFIGNAAFGGNAGELRFQDSGGGNWLVQGDTNGDGVSDFELVLVIPDAHPITSGDFIL